MVCKFGGQVKMARLVGRYSEAGCEVCVRGELPGVCMSCESMVPGRKALGSEPLTRRLSGLDTALV